MSFTATALSADRVLLRWTTASERQLAGFTIATSGDAAQWRPLDYVIAANAPDGHEYSVEVDKPHAGTAYYRLAGSDVDGSTSLTSQVAVTTAAGAPLGLEVFPTPASTTLNVRCGDPRAGGSLVLRDATGRAALTLPAIVTEIPVGELTPELYLLELRSAERTETRKVWIRR